MKSIVKAEQELKRLKALNDGKEYCITMTIKGKFSVGEKTKTQKVIDAKNEKHDPRTANMKITDWLGEQALEES